MGGESALFGFKPRALAGALNGLLQSAKFVIFFNTSPDCAWFASAKRTDARQTYCKWGCLDLIQRLVDGCFEHPVYIANKPQGYVKSIAVYPAGIFQPALDRKSVV